jgi:hypothetical protein
MCSLRAGAKCGATLIDRNFMTWLEQKLGLLDFEELVGESSANAIGSHIIIGPKMQQIMLDFQVIKHQFKGLGDPAESIIHLPNPLNKLHDPSRSIVGGELCITE